MKKNIGQVDKSIRIIIAITIGILIYSEVLTGTLAYILLAVSAILVVTSFLNFCPIYSALGINSCKKKQ